MNKQTTAQSHQLPLRLPNDCDVPQWNQKTTENVTHWDEINKWNDKKSGTDFVNMFDGERRLISAFVYPEEISIITTAMHTFRKPAICHYYDCNRNEMHSARFKSRVWPLAVITCPRRFGAVYVSVSYEDDEVPQEMIPLTYRIFEKPVHELSVCVGPLYGEERKWLQIVEYVEHYRLQGETYFYFTIFNMDEYDRRIIDYYESLGYAETTRYTMEYLKLGWMFHILQIHECHHRSKFHSKWVINMDLDERLVYTGPSNLTEYLRSIPPNIGEISFSVHRVLKKEKMPDKYTNETGLLSEMLFLKYNQTTKTTFRNLKGIIRPEMVAVLFYHWSYFQLKGVHVMSVPKRIGYVRHYRDVDNYKLGGNWTALHNGKLRETRLSQNFEEKLILAVKKRVKYVYEQRMIRCEEIKETTRSYFIREILDCKFKNETNVEMT